MPEEVRSPDRQTVQNGSPVILGSGSTPCRMSPPRSSDSRFESSAARATADRTQRGSDVEEKSEMSDEEDEEDYEDEEDDEDEDE